MRLLQPSSRGAALRRVLAAALLIVFVAGASAGVPPRASAAADAGPPPRPAFVPRHLSIGLMGLRDATGIDGWMPESGIPWDYAYHYLSNGVNTGRGWEGWNPDASFPLLYARDAEARGYLPVFTYYEMQESGGTCGGCEESRRALSNLNDPTVMAAYYANFALLMKRLGPGTWDGQPGYGKATIVHIEPDLAGFVQNALLGTTPCHRLCLGLGNDPALFGASVSSSGAPDVADLPDTYQGFNWALLRLRDRYAPNVVLGFHLNNWMTGPDISSDTRAGLDSAALGRLAGQFAARSGLVAAPPGTSTYDLLFNDLADYDAAYFQYVRGRTAFWDRRNVAVPNFARWEAYLGAAIAEAGGKPAFVWQIPLGNQFYATMDNSEGHYQDNRAEYFFEHTAELAAIGVVGLLFGPGGLAGTAYYDRRGDGITNAPVVCTADGVSEGRVCNDHPSVVADDDGGYLRSAASAYYRAPLPLPVPTRAPAPPASEPIVTFVAGWGGNIHVAAAGYAFPRGTVLTLTPAPAPGNLFLGWIVDGEFRGWADPLTLTVAGAHVVSAAFIPPVGFPDAPEDPAVGAAVTQLATRGILRGYADGRFGPGDPALRAQMAALLVRSMGWAGEDRGTPFIDQGPVDPALWRDVAALAGHDVARGYADGTYRPTEPVLQVQAVAFIARAMVARGYWVAQPDDPALYPTVPGTSGHRADVATWVRYVGPVPGTAADPAWSSWDRPSSRGWFALALWTALDTYFRTDRSP